MIRDHPRPILIHPGDHSRFLNSEMIRFAWRLAPMGEKVVAIKVVLYIGRDSMEPFKDPGVVKKTWICTPGDVSTGYNETAYKLGLDPGETYYWQVAQEIPGEGLILSEVRAFLLEGNALLLGNQLLFSVNHPYEVPQKMPLKIIISLHNVSDSPVRVTLERDSEKVEHFEVRIIHIRPIGGEKTVWGMSPIWIAVDTVEIQPRETYTELVTWQQKDFRGREVNTGEYRVQVRCKAREFDCKLESRLRILR